MLSNNTLLAIQLLHVLHAAKDRMWTITGLKYECQVWNLGNAASRVMRHLRKEGWVECDSRNRYRLVVDLDRKNLLDLVIDMDEEIRLGCRASGRCRDMITRGELPRAREVNERLREDFTERLKSINLGDLIVRPAANSPLQIYEPAENWNRVSGW